MKHNACIQILSSRRNSIMKCIDSIKKFFFEYPIYVHYFDDIYDGWKSDGVEFIQVPYKVPDHIKEEELFHHRDNPYAKRFKGRMGYLHMCNFIFNMYGYPNTKLHEHDYIIVFDDDSGFYRKMPYDPVQVMSKRPEDMGAFFYHQRLDKDGNVPQNHIDTREGLFDLADRFAKEYFYGQYESDFCHEEKWADTYVIKTKMYETDLWKRWNKAVNTYGGIYKHRWGDNELMTLFGIMHNGIYNLNGKDFMKQDLFRDGMAPSVRNIR